ncbi:MAG: DUF2442 domain-containing protein [Planctomycetes bacterium]|nr:DUF2442 domain-containing protein [Planctomycetota bacterium]
MTRIVKAKALDNCRLHLEFEDGVEGTVDLSEMVDRGVFSAWSDPDFFARVTVDPETRTVTWPGGIDLCPDQLYHDVAGAPLPGSQVRTS